MSYLIKGSYAQLWLLSAEQKENQTFSVVHADNRKSLDDAGVKILKELSGNRFLIELKGMMASRRRSLKLLDRNVTFIEIMGHETIALGYLSTSIEEPFSNSASVETIDRRALFSIRMATDIGSPWSRAWTA